VRIKQPSFLFFLLPSV